MPAYNASRTISEAIDSVLNQRYMSWQLWVVDDGSQDNTLTLAKRFAGDCRISVLSQPNAGPAAARDHALEMCSGEYVAFLDADDWWEPTYLESMVACISTTCRYGLVWCDMRLVGDGAGIYRGARGPISGSAEYTIPRIYSDVTFLPSCVICRSAYFRNGLRFPEQFRAMEDVHVWCAIAAESDIGFVDKVMVNYRIHPHSLSTSPGSMLRNYDVNICSYRILYYEYRRYIPHRFYRQRMWWAHHYAAEELLISGERCLVQNLSALIYRPHALITWKNLIKGMLNHKNYHDSAKAN